MFGSYYPAQSYPGEARGGSDVIVPLRHLVITDVSIAARVGGETGLVNAINASGITIERQLTGDTDLIS